MKPCAAAIAIGVAGAAAIAGCGLGPGRGTSDVSLSVTRAFGQTRIAAVTKSKVPGSETVMRMLERSFRVQTRYGGGFVESINGISGSPSRLDWFYYVNGIEASQGAANTPVHHGDRIWWDLHDWSATNNVPAVVGSFPEPFVHGSGGKRFPTALECAADAKDACDAVARELTAEHIPVADQGLGTGSGQDTIAILVGPWSDLQGAIAARLIEQGPGSSGVYARFRGGALQLLDPKGRVVRTLSSNAGLIAATSDRSSSAPTWLVTGTDPQGVASAAVALTPSRLRDHFALAVEGAKDLPVPLDGGA